MDLGNLESSNDELPGASKLITQTNETVENTHTKRPNSRSSFDLRCDSKGQADGGLSIVGDVRKINA